MIRPEYITDEFYECVQHDLKQYSKDYDAIMERTRLLDDLQKEINCRDDESYKILTNFGTI